MTGKVRLYASQLVLTVIAYVRAKVNHRSLGELDSLHRLLLLICEPERTSKVLSGRAEYRKIQGRTLKSFSWGSRDIIDYWAGLLRKSSVWN